MLGSKKRMLAIIPLSMVLVSAFSLVPQEADAALVTCNPGDATVNKSVVNLGNPVTVTVIPTGNEFTDLVIFEWNRPDGSQLATGSVFNADGDLFQDTRTPDQSGPWLIEATCLDGAVATVTVEVTFTVIPESPIGAIAMMGSSMAALGAYMFLRKSRLKVP